MPMSENFVKDYDLLLDATLAAIKETVKNKDDALYLSGLVTRMKPAIYGEFKAVCSLVSAYMKAENGLDRHKRSACHIIALLYKLALDQERERYRERLAIWDGISTLDAFLRAGDSGNAALEAFLIEKGKLEIPEPVCDRGTHIENLEIRLRLAYKKGVDKGVLALFLSSELFLIEIYNMLSAELK
jgi:hypothetical protein